MANRRSPSLYYLIIYFCATKSNLSPDEILGEGYESVWVRVDAVRLDVGTTEEAPCGWQDYGRSIGNVGDKQLSLPEYLSRPWSRIDEYIAILKDLLRYTAKAEQDTGRLEQAIEMIMDLKKQADDLSTLDRITGYPGDLSLLGPVYRHVSHFSFSLVYGRITAPFRHRPALWRDRIWSPVCPLSLKGRRPLSEGDRASPPGHVT